MSKRHLKPLFYIKNEIRMSCQASGIRTLKLMFSFVFYIAITTSPVAASMTVTASSPKEHANLIQFGCTYRYALDAGDFDQAYFLAKKTIERSIRMYGKHDPFTISIGQQLGCLNKVRNYSEKDKRKFCQAHAHTDLVIEKGNRFTRLLYPVSKDLSDHTGETMECLVNPHLSKRLPEYSVNSDELNIARCFAYVAQMPEATLLIKESIRCNEFLELEHSDIQIVNFLALSTCEQIAGFPPQTRRKRLQDVIKFYSEEGTKKQRFIWQEHRARAILAEDFYIEGKKEEADRAFAQLRSEIPVSTNDSLAGWVLFACDRHDARRAYEQGQYKKAF